MANAIPPFLVHKIPSYQIEREEIPSKIYNCVSLITIYDDCTAYKL